jgi:hypothetical protein
MGIISHWRVPQIRFNKENETMDAPEPVDIMNTVRPMIGLGALLLVVFIASNSMPGYVSGERMGLLDGVPAVIDGATPTIPFASPTEAHRTDIAKPAPHKADTTGMTGMVVQMGAVAGFDPATSTIFLALFLIICFTIFRKALRIPYVVAFNRLQKQAWEPDIPSGALKGRLNATLLAVSAGVAVSAGAVFLGGLMATGVVRLSLGRLLVEGLANPLSGIVAVTIIGAILWHGRWMHGKFIPLLARRCPECNAMDSYKLIDSQVDSKQHFDEKTTYTRGSAVTDIKHRAFTCVEGQELRECLQCHRVVRRYYSRNESGHI